MLRLTCKHVQDARCFEITTTPPRKPDDSDLILADLWRRLPVLARGRSTRRVARLRAGGRRRLSGRALFGGRRVHDAQGLPASSHVVAPVHALHRRRRRGPRVACDWDVGSFKRRVTMFLFGGYDGDRDRGVVVLCPRRRNRGGLDPGLLVRLRNCRGATPPPRGRRRR